YQTQFDSVNLTETWLSSYLVEPNHSLNRSCSELMKSGAIRQVLIKIESEFQRHRRNPQPTSSLHRLSVVRALRSVVPHGFTLTGSPRLSLHLFVALSLALTSSSLSVSPSCRRHSQWVVVVVVKNGRKRSSTKHLCLCSLESVGWLWWSSETSEIVHQDASLPQCLCSLG
ncbi:hypothetical protein HN873_019649, partial [Arachis hypogaea]